MYKNDLSKHTGALLLICLLFLCIHVGLFLFDLADPTAFLRGDRAHERIKQINGLLEATPDSIWDLTLNWGVPGDFLQHALLYWIGGRYLLIACQIGVQLFTLIITCVSAARLTGNPTVATATGLFLVVMPGTLMDPHLLTSETWFTAFLTLGVLLICHSVNPSRLVVSAHRCYLGFVGLALASSVRPQGLLVPIAIVACLFIGLERDRGRIFIGGLLSYAIFPISWMTLRFFLIGDFGMGASNAGLATNLGIRADRILAAQPETNGGLTLGAFFEIAASHPWPTLNTFYSDTLNLIFNPGVNHVFSYYLGLFDSPPGFWEQVRDQSGLLGIVTELVRRNAAFVALFIVWTVLHLMILSGTAMVAFRAVRGRSQVPLWVWIFLTVVVTVIASSLTAGGVRWNHRAGAEPLLALLAACGLFGWKSAILPGVDSSRKLRSYDDGPQEHHIPLQIRSKP
jgi:hypothetical protein